MARMNSGSLFYLAAPDRLELRKGGGCLSLFGLPFLMAGLFVMFLGLAVIPLSRGALTPWWSTLIMAVVGMVFAAVGGGLVLGRGWITIDSTQQKIWVSWGLLRPMRTTIYQIADYRSVIIGYKPGDSDTSESYPMSLGSINPGRDLPLCEVSKYEEAVAQGKLLMEFLRFPLEDTSSDHILETTVKDTGILLPEERETEPVPLPENSAVVIRELGRKLEIHIPANMPPGTGWFQFIIPLVMLLVFGRFFIRFFDSTHTPWFVQMFFSAFFFLFFIVIPLIVVIFKRSRATRQNITVSVDSEGFVLDNGGNRPNSQKFIPMDRVMALDYNTAESAYNSLRRSRNMQTGRANIPVNPPSGRLMAYMIRFHRSKGVILKTLDGIFYIGAGLSDAEVQYIFDRISAHLDRGRKERELAERSENI